MTTRTALVTGAAGLLGRATTELLADSDVEVHALVRRSDQAFRDDVEFHETDLTRPLDRAALPERVDAVFHLAQAREFRDFPGSAPQVFAINVSTTAWLLDYASRGGASSFVYASSGGVYRPSDGSPLTEDAALQAPSKLGYYLATKVSSEALVGSYSGQFSTVSLRYFFIYGPGQARSMLIPRLYDRVAAGEAISLQGADGMHINPVHVVDAAAATVAAASLSSSDTLNVAGPQTLSLREIGTIFASDVGREPVFEQGAGDASDLVASTDRMSAVLTAPGVTLEQALPDLRT